MDITKFVDGLIPWVKREISPLIDRISALEQRGITHGKDGINGIDGRDGVDGAPGEKGLDGLNGKDGTDGKDGKDADPEYIKSVIAEEVSKVPAAKDGKDADIQQVKAFIAEEVAKVQAPRDGKDGADGIDGKDGLDIVILPEIDQSKSVPRGTYAAHKNGLWKAYQKTAGMKGWECIVAGIADISIEQTTDRSITIKTVLSNGDAQEKTFALQNTIYKGVFEEGALYEKGDFATWGGSIWHCNEKTSERPREGHNGWTLAVKKGRDYREPVKIDSDPNKPVKM